MTIRPPARKRRGCASIPTSGPPIHDERTIADIVALTLNDAGDPHVAAGPSRNRRSDGASAWRRHLHISTCDPDKQFRTDETTLQAEVGGDLDDIAAMEWTRAALIKRLAACPSRVIHDAGDEITAVRPGERVTALRKAVEAELQT
jgi:hypothetical protein